MELSPADVLDMPRQLAINILERMAGELRQARLTALSGNRVEPKQETETLRARISELESENSDMRKTMDTVMTTKVESMPSFGIVSESQEEMRNTIENNEATIRKLQGKLSGYKTRYKNLKEKMAQRADDEKGDTANRLAAMERELSLQESRYKSALDNHTTAEKSHQRVTKTLEKKLSTLESKLEKVVQRDPQSIFELPQSEAECSCPAYLDLKPYSYSNLFVPPESMSSSNVRLQDLYPISRRSIMLERPDSKDISNLLIVLPHQKYTSRATWETTTHDIAQGKILQLLIQTQHNKISWLYAGQYECVFVSTVPAKDTWAKMENFQRKNLVETTANSARKAPTAVVQTIPQLYSSGAFQIDCIGIRRIGFDVALDKALHREFENERKKAPNPSNPSFSENIQKGKNKKRTRDDMDGSEAANASSGGTASGSKASKRRKGR